MNTDVKKMNKAELAKMLNINFGEVKKTNKSLADRIVYTAKSYKADEKSVTKKDLLDLVNEVSESLGDKFLLEAPAEKSEIPKVESQTKKLKAKSSKKDEGQKPEKKSEPEEEKPEEEPEEEKKPVEKKSSKKLEKKSAVNPHAFVLADTFSDTLTLEDGSQYEIAHDIKNMADLMKAYDNEETVVFAMYWTKRHLSQFGYFNNEFEAPKEFPLDLDIASCIYVSEEGVVSYATSLYTEACYMFLPKDFEEVDGIRFSGGIEFQIYRKVEEPEEE